MGDEVALNISVIQTYDEYCSDLLDTSSSSHWYSFHPSTNSWVKSKIGGVFFLYKRSKPPFYSFMILNRRSSSLNRIESISSAMQVQLHSPFMLYKNGTGEIYSLWFYTPTDCVRISEKIGKLICDLGGVGLRPTPTVDKDNSAKLSQLMNIIRPTNGPNTPITSPQTQLKRASPISKSNQSPNLFDLLHKAEVDFNSKTSTVPDKPDKDITAKLLGLSTACKATSTGLGDGASLRGSRSTMGSQSRSGGHISLVELEQQLLQYPKARGTGEEPANGLSTDDFLASCRPSFERDAQRITVGAPCLPQLSDLDAGYIEDVEDDTCQAFLSDRQSASRKQRRHVKHRESPSAELGHKATTLGHSMQASSRADFQQQDLVEGNDMQDTILMTPDMFSRPAASSSYSVSAKSSAEKLAHSRATPTNQSSSAGLTRSQLREALVHLLETDDSFLDTIHQAYLDSLQRRLIRD